MIKIMIKIAAVIFAIALAAFFTEPLMSVLLRFIVPKGQSLYLNSPLEPLFIHVSFALPFCACAGLVAAVGCYFRLYPPMARLAIVVLPMLFGASIITIYRAAQFHQAVSASGYLGFASLFTVKQAALHTIPLAGFIAGLSAVAVAFFIRRNRASQDPASNGGPVA